MNRLTLRLETLGYARDRWGARVGIGVRIALIEMDVVLAEVSHELDAEDFAEAGPNFTADPSCFRLEDCNVLIKALRTSSEITVEIDTDTAFAACLLNALRLQHWDWHAGLADLREIWQCGLSFEHGMLDRFLQA
ncbi:MAG: hypothetical protein KIS92_00965 [Planctomycetota bacterium]|nr:hypothetical protein [Planctomycetota bacterium]